jgi:general secretion pathway protein K
VLKDSFVIIGEVDDNDASVIAASIVDWRDPDDKPLENGAETGYYTELEHPYSCKNADFQVLDELLQVRGMTTEIFGKMKGRLTVYGLGAVNINTADAAVLRCIGLAGHLPTGYRVPERQDGRDAPRDNVLTMFLP